MTFKNKTREELDSLCKTRYLTVLGCMTRLEVVEGLCKERDVTIRHLLDKLDEQKKAIEASELEVFYLREDLAAVDKVLAGLDNLTFTNSKAYSHQGTITGRF